MEGIGLPVHWLAYGIPADQTIDDFVDGIEERIEPGHSIHHDVREIASNGDAEQKYDEQHQPDLQPGLPGH